MQQAPFPRCKTKGHRSTFKSRNLKSWYPRNGITSLLGHDKSRPCSPRRFKLLSTKAVESCNYLQIAVPICDKKQRARMFQFPAFESNYIWSPFTALSHPPLPILHENWYLQCFLHGGWLTQSANLHNQPSKNMLFAMYRLYIMELRRSTPH